MEFIFATHNEHKVREVSQQFPDFVKFISLSELNYLQEIPETRHTIADNAAQKAETVWDLFGKSCFAEDTGLLVRALNDEPNVYTARYAGEHRSSEDNMRLLLQNLAPYEDRYARFVTVFALVHQGKLHQFEGICEGTIAAAPRGAAGFGYDPVFIPKGYEISFAEMDATSKNQISHRGKALRAMLDFIKKKLL